MFCKRCGARLQEGMLVCPECGARQRHRVSMIRCARCGGRAAVELTVCPHCGLTLRPAGPGWLFAAIGLTVIAVFALWASGRLPVTQWRQTVESARDRLITGLAQAIELAPPASGADQAVVNATATVAPAIVTATRPLTATLTRAATNAPRTVTPTITPTANQAKTYTVQGGDTLEVIGDKLGLPWQTIAAVNGINGLTMLQVGQELRLPTPTPLPTPRVTGSATVTAAATATLAPTATPPAASPIATATPSRPVPTATAAATPTTGATTTYRVQPGDTLAGIGLRFGVDWEAIAAANNLPADALLTVGQALIIPGAGATVAPTATPRPRPTATPVPPTSTPAPSLTAPVLVSPGDNAPFNGEGAIIELEWRATEGLPQGASYQVIVRYLNVGVPQTRFWLTTASQIRAPLWLWGQADQPARQYTWYVTVVQVTTDGKGGEVIIPLSQPSQTRIFTWN